MQLFLQSLLQEALPWIDLIWIPIALFTVHKPQRMITVAFLGSCMLMMRLQVELMHSINYPFGITGFWNMDVFRRGQVIYSIFYVIYIVLAIYSRDTKGVIYMAASISIFFAALFVSMIAMVI